MAPDEPKIIVDEDWKARVQREKEEAAKRAAAEKTAEQQKEPEKERSLFMSLVDRLALEGAMALGLVAPNESNEVLVDLGLAQWVIDVLMDLREKTKGNLTTEEAGRLTNAIADLQQVYVLRSEQVQKAMLKQANLKGKNA